MGEELRSISFEEITACFLEKNQEVVKIILERKRDIWRTPERFELVEEYFDNSLQTLDFCTALDRSLMRARDSQRFINVALQRLEEDPNYAKILEHLELFKAAGDPFTEEFFREFQAVYGQQRSMLEKLMTRKQKLDRKLKSVRAWRKVSCIIFVAAFASALICSSGPMGKWFDSLFKDCETALKGEKEVLSSMQVGTYVTVEDLNCVRVLVDHLEIQISYLLHCVDFALKGEEAVRFGVEGMKKKLGAFMKSVEDLGEQADRCSRDIRRARTVVLQRIIKCPEE